MPLTAKAVEKAKSKEKAYKIYDTGGLHMEISKSGGKWWRLKYRFGGSEKRISLGVYPDVSLKGARERRDESRKQLANGIDPSVIKQAAKASAGGAGSFEIIAREWHIKHQHKWTENYKGKVIRQLELNIFPWLGKRPINAITPVELLSVVRRVENRGHLETAHRTLNICGQVFRYALASGLTDIDITQDLKGAIPPPAKKHMPTIVDPIQIGGLLRAFELYEGSFITKCALKLAPMTFVRPGELRHAEWAEINFEKEEWRIPAEKMKMKQLHIVPLSKQALAILEEIKPLTGYGDAAKYVFPSVRTRQRPMSNNIVNAALRRMGYDKSELTGHGFRSMASTLLNEQGWKGDAIERQLAHGERNSVRASYNYAEYLPERRTICRHGRTTSISSKRVGKWCKVTLGGWRNGKYTQRVNTFCLYS